MLHRATSDDADSPFGTGPRRSFFVGEVTRGQRRPRNSWLARARWRLTLMASKAKLFAVSSARVSPTGTVAQLTTYITQKSSGVMDISAALSSLMKPQFPDHATLLALAMKYQGNYGMPMYANMASPKPQSLPTLDIASLLAAATAQHDVDSKQFLNLPPVMESPSTPTPTLQNVNPATTPLTITAAPSSPSQSSTSASSAGSLANHSALSSPNSAGRASTPVFGSYKMKSSRTPTRKPPAPIPAEKKDDAYFERRKKNNDAAKRSRDSRRRKEEYTAARAAFLEQENFQLKTQIENLKTDLTSLRMVLLKGGMSNIALNQTSAITAALNRPPSTENLKCETSDEASS